MISSSALALDLSDYPNMFTNNVRIIVGKAADAEDVLGAIDIAVTLQQKMGNKRLESAILDTEVDNIEAENTIIVGGPCINSIAAKLMDYPSNCMAGFELGKGKIILYEFENGNYALLVAGTTALDTRRVTTVLSNYKDYEMTGNEMIVARININEINVKIK